MGNTWSGRRKEALMTRFGGIAAQGEALPRAWGVESQKGPWL